MVPEAMLLSGKEPDGPGAGAVVVVVVVVDLDADLDEDGHVRGFQRSSR